MLNMRSLREDKRKQKDVTSGKELEETKIQIKALDYELKGLVC